MHHCDPLPWHRPRGLVVEKLIGVHLGGARLLLLQRPGWRAGQHCHPCLRTDLFWPLDLPPTIAGFFKGLGGEVGKGSNAHVHPPASGNLPSPSRSLRAGRRSSTQPKVQRLGSERCVFPESIPAAQPTEAKPRRASQPAKRKDLGRRQAKQGRQHELDPGLGSRRKPRPGPPNTKRGKGCGTKTCGVGT